MGVELFSLCSEPDALVGADKKLTAQLVFKLFHGTGHIGLAAVEGSGGLG